MGYWDISQYHTFVVSFVSYCQCQVSIALRGGGAASASCHSASFVKAAFSEWPGGVEKIKKLENC